MADTYSTFAPSLDSPAEHAAAGGSGDDATDLTNSTRAVFVGGAGAMKVTMVGGEAVTFTGISAGTVLPLRIKRLWATGLTASNIMLLW